MGFNWRPSKINTQLKGLPQNEDPFDYISKAIQREDMAGYRPSQNVGPINYQHGGNAPINYDGYSSTTPMTEEDIANNAINNNVNARQFGNAGDMASWIQQGGTPQADAAAAQAQAEQQAAIKAEQEAAAKNQEIANIEAQIKALETSIANKTAKLRNFTGNMGKIAAIEARKINAQDPTSIWRWKEGLNQQRINRQEDLERIAKEKEKTKEEQKQAFMNKLNATLPTMTVGLNTTPEQAQMYKNTLAGLEADASNYSITDPRIAELKNSLYGDLPYNAMMSAIDELEDINANYGKGPDYDKMNDSQKFEVFQKKLEEARQKLIDENPALWGMMQKDRKYGKKFLDLLAGRRPKSKGKEPPRAKK